MNLRGQAGQAIGTEAINYFFSMLAMWLVITGRLEAVIRVFSKPKDTIPTGTTTNPISGATSVSANENVASSYPPPPAPGNTGKTPAE